MTKKVFAELDYGQLEARVIAMFSQDRVFTKALWENYDTHAEWAQKLAHAYPDRIGGKKNLADKAVMKVFRNEVKNQFVFPLFFGATLRKASNELRIPMEVVQPIYDEFWRTFSGVKQYQDRMEREYKKKGYVECLTGRRRRAPLSYNQIVNSPIQGTASDIVVDGMNRLSETEEWHLQANLNVHDSLLFEIEEEKLDDHVEVIVREMLNCRYPWINVPLTVEVSIGEKNWLEMEAIGTFSSVDWLDFPVGLTMPTDEALITRYRPKTFGGVIGQNEIVGSLKQILKKATSHSFLFVGPSGTGKTTLARLLAHELGAINPGDITEIDAGQITGIDDMRTLTAGLKYKPIGGSTVKAVILNECHRLSIAAQDALLAALEEPASHTYFFLTTTEGNKIRAAIKTRCASYELKLVSHNILFDWLVAICDAEDFGVTDTVLELCVKEAYGSPRQAIANLAVCSDVKDRETAATLLRSAHTEGHEAIDLCRAIMKGADWEQIIPILTSLQEQNPESIRQVIRAYMTKTILETKHEGTRISALNILEVFSQPFTIYDGISSVILSVGKLLYERP